MELPTPDWLDHRLVVSGPADAVSRFRTAATGTNAAAWALDLDHEEARLLAPMASAGPAARDLAKQLRAVLAARHDRVRDACDDAGACAFDLHRLAPVPPAILALGPDDPKTLDWLRQHWGTTRPLRDVRLLPGGDRRLRRTARVGYAFFSADWTPWAAFARLRRDWPDLVFDVRPVYGDG